ncbi:MAG TPA: arylesterase [Pyrinomonadaceae bacterium]|nr:arylesterase [Pyrinomonadaceae bacterium]
MKYRLFAFGLFVSACFFGCGGAATRNAATSENNATASQAPVAPSRQNQPKIVAFGDSLTAGYGLKPSESYPSILQQKLDADGYKYEVVNAGVSGDTSAGGLRRIDWSLESGDVRFVILELGANDFLRGQPVAETRKNLAQIIERAKARGAQVLLAGMYTTTNAGREYQKEIQDGFDSLARQEGVTLIPFFLEGVAGIESLNQDDRIHPNAEGTRLVADTVYKYLKPLLDKQGSETKK